MHKLIDGNIAQFTEEHRKSIKDVVFRKAATRSSFFINADEIFTSALSIKDQGSDYYDSLENWMSVNQEYPVTREELMSLADKLKGMSFEELEAKLEDVVDVVDEQEKIERRIQEISRSMRLGEVTEVEKPIIKEVQAVAEKAEKTKPVKNLFVKAEKPAPPEWDLDKEIRSALKEPKPVEEISVMGKKPVEITRPYIPERRSDGLNPTAGLTETDINGEGFSRKDADTFFDVIKENSDKRRKRLRGPKNGGFSAGLENLFKSIAPAKKARLQDVLLQLIILLVFIVGVGTLIAISGSGKNYMPVSEKLTKDGAIVDTYGEIFDIYLTTKSKNLR